MLECRSDWVSDVIYLRDGVLSLRPSFYSFVPLVFVIVSFHCLQWGSSKRRCITFAHQLARQSIRTSPICMCYNIRTILYYTMYYIKT
jgi:hypothetical protein